MEMTETQLIESKELRNQYMESVEVLDKVKALVLLHNDIGATTQMVANYFEVEVDTIKYHMYTNKEHAEELKENGMKTLTKEEIVLSLPNQLKTKRGGFDILDEKGNIVDSGSNKGITVLTRRTILNLAMMLEGSLIAKEIRKQLLDAMEEKQVVKTVVNNITEEQQLQLAIFSAETEEERLLAMSRLNAFHKRHIVQLENVIEEQKEKVTYHDLVLSSSDAVAITVIAKDYNMSGAKFNLLLNEVGVQYKVDGTWVLYSKYDGKGYTKTDTYSNGDISKIITKWTQKGRLFIYETLKEKLGMLPSVENIYSNKDIK